MLKRTPVRISGASDCRGRRGLTQVLGVTMHMDSSPLFSLPWAIAFWGTYVLAFYVSEASVVRHTKATRGDGPSLKQDSLAGLTIFALAAKLLALVFAWLQVAEISSAVKPWFFGLGIGFMVLGAALRQHCFRMLGPAFTIEVRTAQDQQIVDRGAYKYVRHPGYLAGIIMMLGFGVATTSLAAVAVMLIAALYVYVRRIELEEAALERSCLAAYRRTFSSDTRNGRTLPACQGRRAFAPSRAFATRRLEASGRAFGLPGSTSSGASFTGLWPMRYSSRWFVSPLMTMGKSNAKLQPR